MIELDFILRIFLIFISSYLIGALPTAYLVGKLHGVNVFEVGSGNMGGTNVARAMGLGWGLLTSALDICKGVAAVWLAQQILPEPFSWHLVGSIVASTVVISGHNWSIFASLLYRHYNPDEPFSMRGGKGAATAFGTMMLLVPPQAVAAGLALGVILVIATRYVSLSVLMTFAVALTWSVVLVIQQMLPLAYLSYVLLLTLLILWRFRGNIQRLLQGNERRLGERV